MTYFKEFAPAKWVQVDARPHYANFRNKGFFYNDVKIEFDDWSLNDKREIYLNIINHDNDVGWATINLEVVVT
jgi:hypothetical protein